MILAGAASIPLEVKAGKVEIFLHFLTHELSLTAIPIPIPPDNSFLRSSSLNPHYSTT
jgi:hypothetical protein